MVAPFPVTRIRYDELQGRELIRHFLSQGHLAPVRPPRGVDPIVVRDVILDAVDERSGMSRVQRALECLRYYETEEVAPHLARVFAAPIGDAEDIRRACYAVQATAEPLHADSDLVAHASRYFDEVVVPHADALTPFSTVLETLTVLAPYHTDAALIERIDREVAALAPLQSTNDAAAIEFDRLISRKENDIPRMRRDIGLKLEAAALQDRAERVRSWVEQCIGRAYVAEVVQTRAARLLRVEGATYEGREVVKAAFFAILDEHTPGQPRSSDADLQIAIAGQALSFFNADFSERHLKLLKELQEVITTFLNDA